MVDLHQGLASLLRGAPSLTYLKKKYFYRFLDRLHRKTKQLVHLKAFISLLLLFILPVRNGNSQSQAVDKASFYSAIASGKQEVIDQQLAQLKSGALPDKEAYEGTLLMTKAGLVKLPKNRLSFFKSGRSKLEAAISKDKNNIEYRFLRIIIQEHAPKIVKYHSDLEEDSKLIHSSFRSLPEFMQQQIINYSKNSTVLKAPW